MVLVRLLGPIDLVDESGVVRAPASALRRSLLALLALHAGRVLTADWLLEHLWSDEPPASGLRALRFHVSQLRKEVGSPDLIDTQPGGYRLAVRPDDVDALAVESKARDARGESDRQRAADAFAELLSTWRGTPFTDAAPCAALDTEATRLVELQLSLIEEHLQARLDCGADRQLVADLTRLTTQHPLRESLWAMLITAQYCAGLQADALRSYEQMRLLLAESLGLDPSNELQDLQRRVLQQDPSLRAQPRPEPAMAERLAGPGRRLPATKELIGRQSLIEDLVERVDSSRLITLVGPGGVGKTSTAISVAERRSGRHLDGAWFVDLTRVASGELVPTAIATAVGLHANERGVDIGDVVDLLYDKALFLVIDNCEHVVDESATAIEEIVSRCAQVHVLATSREALGLLDEVAVRVPALDEDSALALLSRRAAHLDAVPLSRDDEPLASALCRAVDHLPLGIELVAGRLRSMPISDVVRQLEAGALLRSDGQRGANTRHRSLHSMVAWSYDLLPGECQALLRRLAVFQGGARLDSIVAVCGDAQIGSDEASISHRLDTLVNTSLVSVERADGAFRYRLLETVRAFALELLTGAEEDATRARHVREMIAWCMRMRRVSEGTSPATAFAAIHAESANLRGAVEHCMRIGDHVAIAEVVGALGPLLGRHSGAIVELEDWVELALSLDEVDPVTRIDVLLVGAFAAPQPDDVVRTRAESALALATESNDPRALAFAEFVVGDSAIDEFSPVVEQHYRTAIDVAEAAGMFPISGGAINSLANALIRGLRYDDANVLLGSRLSTSSRYGMWEAFILYHNARLQLLHGSLDESEAGFDAAMRAAERSGVPMATGYALYGYGILAEARGDLATARAWFERSLVIDEQVNERHDVLNDHIFLGSLCVALGDVDAARLHCAAIADLASSNPGRREVAARERLLGEIALAEGRLDEGRRHLVESMRVLSSTKMTDFFLSTLDVLIRAAPPQTQATLAAVAEDVRGGRVPMPEAVSVIEHTSGTTTS